MAKDIVRLRAKLARTVDLLRDLIDPCGWAPTLENDARFPASLSDADGRNILSDAARLCRRALWELDAKLDAERVTELVAKLDAERQEASA